MGGNLNTCWGSDKTLLTEDEAVATKAELKQNFELAGLTLTQAANDLGCTPNHIQAVLNLNSERIEEPWILRNYLMNQLLSKGIEPHPYSKLIGDPKRFAFLNDDFIKQGRLA